MRKKKLILCCLALLTLFACSPLALAVSDASSDSRLFLRTGWRLQSSCKIQATGEQISSASFRTDGWHSATVPATVVAALVADGTFPDPYFGMNLRSIPGATYPIGKSFANLPMPKDSPFRCSWWYRTEFRLPPHYKGRVAWLHFDGINYRANIWVNGRKLAEASKIAGAYRRYEFEVTELLESGGANVLAVETFAPAEKDLGINWVDWNPAPPDKDMGLWGDVYLAESGPLSFRYPQVVTHFPDSSLERADLTVVAELRNASAQSVSGVVEGEIGDVRFGQQVELQARQTRSVIFTSEKFPQLQIHHPKLWWPAQMGPPNLQDLSLRVSVEGMVSDQQRIRFGIREITSELNEQGYRLFRVNGKRILIRGGGWAQDMLLRRSTQRLETEFAYVRDLNLNTIRLEGMLESDDFFDLADEQGILVMAGWCCCDHWERWREWGPGDLPIAMESLRSQALRLRSHPSLLVWLNGSDEHPPSWVERAYLDVLKQTAWPNPILASASQKRSKVFGASGVKMTGPYDYVPPSYWFVERRNGGAYGFNTETSPGPAIPPITTLRKILPAGRLWPIDESWNFHAGLEGFQRLDHYNEAMKAIYGEPSGLGDYLLKSQAMAYDGERAMFEAYSRRKYASTGIIQWMLNNGWPSLFWHLYDYYLHQAGGYFGAKKACEPLHVQYSYDDRSVVVVNSSYQGYSGLTAIAGLYNFDLEEKFSQQVKLDIGEDTSKSVLAIPPFSSVAAPQVYFLKLALRDSAGRVLSSNFYWLSTKVTEFEWTKADYKYTAVASYEDLSMLSRLPCVRLEASATIERGEQGTLVRVRLSNPGPHLAFQVHLGVRAAGDAGEIVPVFWDDNYFALMPGESRVLTARFPSREMLGENPELEVDGWNIERAGMALSAPQSRAEQTNFERGVP